MAGGRASRGVRLLGRAELAERLRARRAAGKAERIVLTNGCFDLLHVGHLRYLEGARACGDVLVVALNSDASVRAIKGEGRPLQREADRAELLLGLRAVDYVVLFDEPTLEETLRALRPDVHAKGTDYTVDTVPERHVDAELGIEIAICGDPKTRSTTGFLARLPQAAGDGASP